METFGKETERGRCIVLYHFFHFVLFIVSNTLSREKSPATKYSIAGFFSLGRPFFVFRQNTSAAVWGSSRSAPSIPIPVSGSNSCVSFWPCPKKLDGCRQPVCKTAHWRKPCRQQLVNRRQRMFHVAGPLRGGLAGGKRRSIRSRAFSNCKSCFSRSSRSRSPSRSMADAKT